MTIDRHSNSKLQELKVYAPRFDSINRYASILPTDASMANLH